MLPFMDDPALKAEGKKWVRHFGCAGCHEIAGMEDEGRIGTELTYEGSKPIERLDFALFTTIAQRGGKDAEPITNKEDLARLPDGPANAPWYDQKGFFEHKLAEPNVYDKGKIKGELEASRMPNLHLTKEQVLDLTTFLMGSEETSLPASYQYKPGDARHDIQEGWWVVKKYNCMGCHQFIPGQQTDSDGIEAVSGCAGAVAAEAVDGRRARRSGMAAQVPVESGVEHHRYEPQRRASLLESAHADVLVLGQRTAQAGAILPGAVAAADALYSGAGAGAYDEGNGHGAELVLEHGCALPEVPRHGRSRARQDRDRAELPAGKRAPEAGLGGALDYRSAGGQPGNVDAIGTVQAAEQSVGICRADAAVVPGIRGRSSQAADRLHLPVDAGRTAEGGGVYAARESGAAAEEQSQAGGDRSASSGERRIAVESCDLRTE